MNIPGTTLEVVIVSRAVVRDRPTGRVLFEIPQDLPSESEPLKGSWVATRARNLGHILASQASMFRDADRLESGSPDHIKQPGEPEPEPDEDQVA